MQTTVSETLAQDPYALPPLPGIDIKAGLAITMNNLKLYRRMLIRFRNSQGQFGDLFAAARAGADALAPERAAHTLKGNAGNIGARDVQVAAGELEQACNDGAPAERITELLDQTLAALAPVLAGLSTVEGEAPAPGSQSPVLTARSAQLQDTLNQGVKRLKVLLEDCDSESVDLIAELTSMGHGTPLAPALAKAAAAIANSDFDVALEALSDT